jgi:hypothetical protein
MKWFTRIIGTRSRERLDSDLETLLQPPPIPGDASDDYIKAIIRSWCIHGLGRSVSESHPQKSVPELQNAPPPAAIF